MPSLITLIIAGFLIMTIRQVPRLQQDAQPGKYRQIIRKNKSGQSIIVGRLWDIETGEPLKTAAVRIDDQLVKADTNGIFSVVVRPGSYSVTGVCYSYNSLTTNVVQIKAGRTLFIDFKLHTDETPTTN